MQKLVNDLFKIAFGLLCASYPQPLKDFIVLCHNLLDIFKQSLKVCCAQKSVAFYLHGKYRNFCLVTCPKKRSIPAYCYDKVACELLPLSSGFSKHLQLLCS